MQDSTILVRDGYCGIAGGAGAGGSHEMVEVIGGQVGPRASVFGRCYVTREQVGLDYTESMNTPTITGARLINQTLASVIYSGLEALSVRWAALRF